MRFFAVLGLTLGLGVAASAQIVPMKTPAKEFSFTETNGKTTLLSTQKGKVVVIQFLQTTCPHCQATARVFSKVQQEMAPKGVQFFGVAFNEETVGHPEVVKNFIQQNAVGFPVALVPRDTVESYLNLRGQRYVVPQIMVIDKKGMIRAMSDPREGTVELQDPATLKPFIESLLKEGAVSAAPAKKAPTAVAAATK